MKTLLTALALLALTGCAHVDDWDRTDTKIYVSYLTAAALDTRSTQRAQYHSTIVESNPAVVSILGQNPDSASLWQMYITGAIANYFISRALPSNWRKPYLTLWTFGHSAAWVGNCITLAKVEDNCI